MGKALEVVKGVEKDYSKMFECLDDKFGNRSKIVDAVIREIKTLRPIPEGKSKKCVDMVNNVEQ